MLQTKALYNLLRLNAEDDPSIQAEPWALENLRSAPLEELFSRLQKYDVYLDKSSFQQFAESCETPEELTDLLLSDEDEKERDPFYLLVFELWRRLFPERQSLSIFCDEIDHRISLYDQGELESDEVIQDVLANLLEVLDENADTGADPEQVFGAICDYCAHDLESFLYDYISDLLDNSNSLYASELIEGFAPYVIDPHWFDFLRARLLTFTDISDANLALHRLLETEVELPLLLEVIRFLSTRGESELFLFAVKKALPIVVDSEELEELLTFLGDYFRHRHEEGMERSILKILKEREEGPVTAAERQILENLLAHQ